MNNYRKLIKNAEFIIYGGGEVGNNCYRKLCEQGYHVLAALDKKKSGKHIVEGLYTYQLGTEPIELDKANCIVIICLANGMIHKDVADELYSLGYSYIVFLPLNYCMPDKQKRELTRLYNYVLSTDPAMKEHAVLNYIQYTFPYMTIDGSIIHKTSQNMTVWMRLELMFSESLELWQGDKSKMKVAAEYKDKNIACGNPCEALFDFYDLRTNSYDAYFDSRKKSASPEEKKKELGQREELYRLFKREYEKGMDFFIEGAPEVVWNPKNYCNLVGGHHRTLFLLHEEQTIFPVKMKYSDFDKWYNESVFFELKQYIYDHHIGQFYAPLPHPCFLNFPVQWEDIGRTKLADIMRFFAKDNISDMTVLDCSNDEGYFARNMDRINAKKVVFLNENLQERELANLFNRLLYRNDVQIREGELAALDENLKFDIVFALGRNDVTAPFSKEQLELLGNLCGQYLIMETTKEEDIIYIQAYTGLKNYVSIHREYKAGQIWELGVYSM